MSSEEPGATLLLVEDYLASEEFDVSLHTHISQTLRGQGANNIPESMLIEVIMSLHEDFPKSLQNALPKTDEPFIRGVLSGGEIGSEKENKKEKIWELTAVPELVAMALLNLASCVDKFRELGGEEINASHLPG